MAKKTEEKIVEVKSISVKYATVRIEGDGDIVLNKMNASNERQLTADDRKAQGLWEAQHRNKWEDVITSLRWRDGIPCEDTNAECTEEMLSKMFTTNAPCISSFGLKKSWMQAVVQNEIDKYSTKFSNAVNVIATGGNVPIKFTEWNLETKVMNPPGQKGSAITVRLSHFKGWSADINIQFTENVYSLTEIITIINCAGFGIGIGSGRSSGYGRYHVTDVKVYG